MARTPDLMALLTAQEEYYKTAYRRGLWRAQVVSVTDSEKRGRIQVRILQLHQASSLVGTGQVKHTGGSQKPLPGVPDSLCPWAEPAFPFGGSVDNGFLMLPKVGSTVWVAFEMGFTGKPVWLGGWYGADEVPSEFAADPAHIRMIRSLLGHTIILDDTPGTGSGDPKILIESAAGHSILLADKPGIQKVKIETVAGHRILLDDTSGAEKIDIRSQAGHEVLIDDAANSITAQLSGGTQKVEVLPTQLKLTAGAVTLLMNTTTGVVTITCTGLSVSASGPGTAVSISGGQVQLGNGVTFDGVVLGAAMKTLYDAHTHSDPGGGNTGPPNAAMVAGTHYSTNVKAKA